MVFPEQFLRVIGKISRETTGKITEGILAGILGICGRIFWKNPVEVTEEISTENLPGILREIPEKKTFGDIRGEMVRGVLGDIHGEIPWGVSKWISGGNMGPIGPKLAR